MSTALPTRLSDVAELTPAELEAWGLSGRLATLYGVGFGTRSTEQLRRPMDPANLTHYLGFELEVEWSNAVPEEEHEAVLRTIKRRHPWVSLVNDYSLGYGFEIVSLPMSYRYFRSILPDFQDTLTWLSKLGLRSYEPATCGIHVHQSYAAFTAAQAFRFELFLTRNKQFAKFVSQRRQSQMRWCDFADEAAADAGLDLKEYLRKKAKGKHVGYDEKGSAVVVCYEHPTVELRLMRGTLNPKGFAKSVEFAVALHGFAARTPCKDLTVPAFVAWTEQRKVKFPNLAEFLDARRAHIPSIDKAAA